MSLSKSPGLSFLICKVNPLTKVSCPVVLDFTEEYNLKGNGKGRLMQIHTFLFWMENVPTTIHYHQHFIKE